MDLMKFVLAFEHVDAHFIVRCVVAIMNSLIFAYSQSNPRYFNCDSPIAASAYFSEPEWLIPNCGSGTVLEIKL
jgi:hypothetical protein